jgi:hypothetical protein
MGIMPRMIEPMFPVPEPMQPAVPRQGEVVVIGNSLKLDEPADTRARPTQWLILQEHGGCQRRHP